LVAARICADHSSSSRVESDLLAAQNHSHWSLASVMMGRISSTLLMIQKKVQRAVNNFIVGDALVKERTCLLCAQLELEVVS